MICELSGGCCLASGVRVGRGELLDNIFYRDYIVIMKTSLVQIGNSRGVRIPKVFLEETGLEKDIEMEVRGRQLVIRAARHPRAGWDQEFAAMAARGDDQLLAMPS